MKDDNNSSKVATPDYALWLMGPTSSGKTTLAGLLVKRLLDDCITAINFDGEEVRIFFGDSLGFAPSDRKRVVSTLVKLTNKATASGINVIVSALTAHQDARALVRETVAGLIYGYVKCPMEICAKRDPKGLYAQAKKNEIDNFVGVNSEYLPPENPDKSTTWPLWPYRLRTSSSQAEGAKRDWCVSTAKFSGKDGKLTTLHVRRLDENLSEIPGSEFTLPAELVLLAMGFVHPVHDGMIESFGLKLDERGNVKASTDDYQTTVPKLFAAGDMRRGQSLVVWAIREGRQCAQAVDEFLTGGSVLPR